MDVPGRPEAPHADTGDVRPADEQRHPDTVTLAELVDPGDAAACRSRKVRIPGFLGHKGIRTLYLMAALARPNGVPACERTSVVLAQVGFEGSSTSNDLVDLDASGSPGTRPIWAGGGHEIAECVLAAEADRRAGDDSCQPSTPYGTRRRADTPMAGFRLSGRAISLDAVTEAVERGTGSRRPGVRTREAGGPIARRYRAAYNLLEEHGRR
jgi:hypothetical protein